MHESLLRLDFNRCRVAIAADRHRIGIASPIQIAADYQRSCFRGVADAYRPLEVILVGLRHFSGGVQSVRPTRSEKPKGIINFLSQSTKSGPTIWSLTCSPTE